MDKRNAFLVGVILFLIGILIIFFFSWKGAIIYLIVLVLLEIAVQRLIKKLRTKFPWWITKEDGTPTLSEEGLKKFIPFGYDPELGWVRKPNTQHEEWGPWMPQGHIKHTFHINEKGARANPGFEQAPAVISCYGDSFTFARQVKDEETWAAQLSALTRSNVLNFGVGNYGLDQALLRLKREYPSNPTKIVIMGIVPSAIVRILDVWKHYNEYGNTFGFKPRFGWVYNARGQTLMLQPNIINTEEKYRHYQQYLPLIQEKDYFYTRKFRKEMLEFPYLVSLLSDPQRNLPLFWLTSYYTWFKKDNPLQPYPTPMSVIMKVNLRLRYKLYTKDTYATTLLTLLAKEFATYGKQQGFTPIFLLMPQKDDILFIRKHGRFYQQAIDEMSKHLPLVDFTDILLAHADLDALYSDHNDYGGHYSARGNVLLAETLYADLQKKDLWELKKSVH